MSAPGTLPPRSPFKASQSATARSSAFSAAACAPDPRRSVRAEAAVSFGKAAAAAGVAALLLLRRRRRDPEDVDDWRGSAQATLIGATPLVRLASLSRLCGCDVYGKCEHLGGNETSWCLQDAFVRVPAHPCRVFGESRGRPNRWAGYLRRAFCLR